MLHYPPPALDLLLLQYHGRSATARDMRAPYSLRTQTPTLAPPSSSCIMACGDPNAMVHKLDGATQMHTWHER
jgi:hypothetical protein